MWRSMPIGRDDFREEIGKDKEGCGFFAIGLRRVARIGYSDRLSAMLFHCFSLLKPTL
jgi:hypothetical protein